MKATAKPSWSVTHAGGGGGGITTAEIVHAARNGNVDDAGGDYDGIAEADCTGCPRVEPTPRKYVKRSLWVPERAVYKGFPRVCSIWR